MTKWKGSWEYYREYMLPSKTDFAVLVGGSLLLGLVIVPFVARLIEN